MRLIQVVSLLVGFSGTSCRDEKQHVSEFRNAAISRAPRASPDEFSAITDQLAVTARLLTAITLQNGLVDGSIPSDKALAELLNVESVDLSQIENFDKKNVDGFVGKLKALGPSIAVDKQVLPIEDMFLLMNKWRVAYSELGNFENTSTAVAHLKTLQAVNTASFNYSFLDNLVEACELVSNSILLLGKYDVNVDIGALRKIHRELKNVLNETKQLKSWIGELEKLESLLDLKFTEESPQRKFVDLLDDFYLRESDVKRRLANEYQLMIDSLSKVSALIPDIKSLGGGLKVVGAVISSKSSSLFLRRQYAGLQNGFADIQKLASDPDNPQFREIVQGFESKKIKLGLHPLQSLMASATAVEKSWAGLFDADSIRAGRLAKDIDERFKTFGTVTINTTSKIDSCAKTPQSSQAFYNDVAVLFKTTSLLRKLFAAVSPLTAKLSNSFIFSNTSDLSKMKDTTVFSNYDQSTMVREAPEVLVELKKLPINETAKVLIDVKSQLEEFKSALVVSNLSVLVQQLSTVTARGSSVFSTFFSKRETLEFKKFFGCLRNVSTQLESACSEIELTRNIRKIDKDAQFTVIMDKLSKAMDESRVAVKTLRSASAALKGNQDPEVQEITKLKGLEKEAGIFGTSVMALDHVRHVLKKKDQLEKFLEDGSRVEEEIGKVNDSKTRSELKEDWGVFEATKQDLSGLLTDLEKRRDQMKIPKASKFADYAPVFSAMKGLKGVDLQVRKRLKVLETLGATNQSLNNVKAQLEQLGDLDLQFARFNKPLSAMTTTLDNLDKMFKSLNEAGIGQRNGSSSSNMSKSLNDGGNGQRNGSSASLVSDPNSDSNFLYILILIGIVACVIVGGVLLWVYCKKREGKKNANKDVPPIVQNGSTSSNEAEKKKTDADYDFTPVDNSDRATKLFRELCWDYRNEEQVKEFEGTDYYGLEHNRFEDLLKAEISDKRTLVEQWFDKLIKMQPHTGVAIKNNNRFLGGALRFCVNTQPKSNTDKGLWYPANIVKLPIWSSMIVAQGPLLKERFKDDTRPAFWHMAFSNLVEHIVMVCGLTEACQYFPIEIGTSKKYGDYVVTLESEKKFIDNVNTRVFIVVNSKTKEERRVKHWNFTSWPQGRKLPEDCMKQLLSMIEVLKATRFRKNPLIVHGTDSTGRAAAYVGTEYIFQKFFNKSDEHPTLPLILAELRAMCSTLFKHGFHVFYAGLAACHCVNSGSKTPVISAFTLNLNWNHYLQFFKVNGDLDAKDRQWLESYKKKRELCSLVYKVMRPSADKVRDVTVTVSETDLRPNNLEVEGAPAKTPSKKVDIDKASVEEVEPTQ